MEQYKKWKMTEIEKRKEQGFNVIEDGDENFTLIKTYFYPKETYIEINNKLTISVVKHKYKKSDDLMNKICKFIPELKGFMYTEERENCWLEVSLVFEYDGQLLILKKSNKNVLLLKKKTFKKDGKRMLSVNDHKYLLKVVDVFTKVVAESITSLRLLYLVGEKVFEEGVTVEALRKLEKKRLRMDV